MANKKIGNSHTVFNLYVPKLNNDYSSRVVQNEHKVMHVMGGMLWMCLNI